MFPKLAPCLACPNTGEAAIDVDKRPGSRYRAAATVLDQVDQVHPRHRRQLQVVPVGELPQKLAQRRRRIHLTEQPRHPPVRTTSTSSMLSASAAIPATIEVILPAGFATADRTRVAPIATLLATNSDRPVRSASAITRTRPRATRGSHHRTRLRSRPAIRQLHRQCPARPRVEARRTLAALACRFVAAS